MAKGKQEVTNVFGPLPLLAAIPVIVQMIEADKAHKKLIKSWQRR